MTTMARFRVAVTEDSTISKAGPFHREEGFPATASLLKWRENQFRHALIGSSMPACRITSFYTSEVIERRFGGWRDS